MDHDDLEARWAPTLRGPEQGEQADAETDRKDVDLQFTAANPAWEDAVGEATKAADAPHTGVMVAFYPTPDQQRELSIAGGEPEHELHLTLAFLGEVGAEMQPQDEAKVIAAVTAWASTQQPVPAITNGHGIFATPSPVTYANVDAPALPTARQSLVEHLDRAGVAPLQTHGYTPHMTLAYDELRDITVPDIEFLFEHVVVAFAGNHTKIPLTGDGTTTSLPEAAKWPVPPTTPGRGYGLGQFGQYAQPGQTWTPSPTWQVTPNNFTINNYSSSSAATFDSVTTRPEAPTISTYCPPETQKEETAFVTDINGKTLITARAAAIKMPSVEEIASEHMLWMHGRFVGAEVPNRNGALWSAGDLEMAQGTVAHGPLNWLHDARHVIGSIARADYINPSTVSQMSAGDGQKPGPLEPHITATAGIWRWIYPDEAYVVQQASDQEMLWYSMECISKEVACAGENGCGNTVSYTDYMAGASCDHIRQRASVRQFKDPIFLGGAVIVPPTRPGWAEADARVMQAAGGLAEAAFEQAGRPEITSSDWEKLMAQLVKYAS